MKYKKKVNQNNRRRAGRKRTAKVTLLIIVTVPLLDSFDSMMQQSSLQRIESSSFPNAVCVIIWIQVELHWTGLEASLSRRPTWPQRCPSSNCRRLLLDQGRQLPHGQQLLWASSSWYWFCWWSGIRILMVAMIMWMGTFSVDELEYCKGCLPPSQKKLWISRKFIH